MAEQRVVAVTGATGFIGQVVIQSLAAAGIRPRLLVRRYPQGALPSRLPVEITLGDLSDEASLRRFLAGADAVIHLAGAIKAPDAAAFTEANAGGTERLLKAAAAVNPTAAFLQISSLAAREPQLSPYAASKRAGEERVRALAGERPWAILRPPAVYGPGDPATLPLFQAASLGFVPYPAAAGTRVSLIHVADLAAAIRCLTLALADRATAPLVSGICFQIDDGYPNGHDWTQMLAALSAATGRRVRAVRLPRWLMAGVALGNALKARLTGRAEVLMPHKVAELYHADWVATGPRLPAVLGWAPQFDLKSGFSDTLSWYRHLSLVR